MTFNQPIQYFINKFLTSNFNFVYEIYRWIRERLENKPADGIKAKYTSPVTLI